MIIGLDVDCPIANIHPAWLNAYNEKYGDNLCVEDITTWNMHEIVKLECGKNIYNLLTPAVYKATTPTVGALDGVKQLRELGHKLVFITTPTRLTMGVKYDWLKEYGFLESDKEYVEAFDKSIFAIDILVDDYIENLRSFRGNGILYNAPWNKSIEYSIRFGDWNNLIRWIKYRYG